MSGHVEGRAVSSNTYSKYGCRCDGCTAAAVQSVRNVRARHGAPPSLPAFAKAKARAVAWMKQHHRDVWDEIYAEEYAKAAAARPPIAPQDRSKNRS